MVVKDKVLVSVGDIDWVCMINLGDSTENVWVSDNGEHEVSSATVLSKQDARRDERVSALRQDGEDDQRIGSSDSKNDWSWSVPY